MDEANNENLLPNSKKQLFIFNLNDTELPSKFNNEIVTEADDEYVVRANIESEDDIKNWVREFGTSTMTQWNSRRSHAGVQKISKAFVCHHSSFMKRSKDANGCNKRGISKNADCMARIRVYINVSQGRYACNRDPFLKFGLCAKIRISRKHTHALKTANTLRFLQDKEGLLRETFFEYFDDNMTAAAAKHFHEHKLKMNSVSEAEFAKGSVNPSVSTTSYWFSQWRSLNLGPNSECRLLQKLKIKKRTYAERGVIIEYTESPFSVLIITPLMQRVHKLPLSTNLAFIDTTNACDADAHSVTFILTPSAAGAVPLAVLITRGQSTETYSNAFQLLKNTLPSGFGNQGFPSTTLTDYTTAEMIAVKKVWPRTKHLFCVFHVLQTVWRWLWNSTNKIEQGDRIELMNHFKEIMYAENVEQMEIAYNTCLQQNLKYQNWIKYLNEYWQIKEKWVLVYRDENVRSQHTSYYTETSIRTFKEVVLSKMKANNVMALVDFSATTLEEFYTDKLNNFANFQEKDSFSFFLESLDKISYLGTDDIVRIGQFLFLVPSEKDHDMSYYTVDAEVGSCSCDDGKLGRFCKHQKAIYQYFNIHSTSFPRIDKNDRHEMAKIALGETCSDNFFQDDFQMISPAENTEMDFNTSPILLSSAGSILPLDVKETTDYKNDSTSNENENEELLTRICTTLEEKVRSFSRLDDVTRGLQQYIQSIQNISSEEMLLDFLRAPVKLEMYQTNET